jgi:hypothetical protein
MNVPEVLRQTTIGELVVMLRVLLSHLNNDKTVRSLKIQDGLHDCPRR